MTTMLRLQLSPVSVSCVSHVTLDATPKRKQKVVQQPGRLAEDVYEGNQLRERVKVTYVYSQ